MPRALCGDGIRLGQVLANLVSNAVKFTDRGSVAVEASAGAAGPGWWDLRVTVRDTGIGLAPDQMERLFQPFRQADSSVTRRFGGTGLGLVISRRLCELMGGGIEVASQAGRGSAFVARVRVEEAPEAEASPAVPSPEPPAQAGERRLRVLVAEDNPVNQRLTLALLQKLGHRAESSVNGKDAAERAAAEDFDLILMDIHMPEMDGLTAARIIREGEARTGRERVPIIAVTADVLEETLDQCRRVGMDDCLVKPINPVAFREALARVVR